MNPAELLARWAAFIAQALGLAQPAQAARQRTAHQRDARQHPPHALSAAPIRGDTEFGGQVAGAKWRHGYGRRYW